MDGKKVPITFDDRETVDMLISKVSAKTGTVTDKVRLVYNGLDLERGKPLSFYNIEHGSLIELFVRTEGGWF